ncbi:CAP domain-containing protein [Shimia marina]|uniref:Cysteine-rich secretory protein family protein n=1 Tax=Shimia marina TaxID=321267 RepID=A0A0P1FA48_9RHOB|nr:CAP domain-containing protein [Shimia marina]CUH51538.1 Cysteine-rich secretory protein family protein [Shimia marina]SFD46637.1 Cysteine-rich secretory protein family protein [Shimia marina]
MRAIALLLVATLGLVACGPGGGASGAKQYKISSSSTARVQFRVLDSINALRQASGAQTVELNAQLNAAAATHARDMSLQNRPWHFGSDGSSPLDRVARVGYTGILTGETISETYETEVETLAAWMEQSDTRAVILDPEAQDMGFAWFQEDNGKIWWTLVMGRQIGTQSNVQLAQF